MTPSWPCLGAQGAATRLDLLIVPNAGRTEAVGLQAGALKLRLAAPPVEGKANQVLLRWLAHELKLPRHALALLRGQSARRKTLLVQASADVLAEWLDGLPALRDAGDDRRSAAH